MRLWNSALAAFTLTASVLGASWAYAGAGKGTDGMTAASGDQDDRTPELKFAVLSDIHVQQGHEPSVRKLGHALKDLEEAAPDIGALVVNGDLGNGQPADYELLAKLMRSLPHPEQVYYTMGNHEFYKAWMDGAGSWNAGGFPNGETEAASIGRYLNYTGYPKVYRDAWVEGYHFLFLGSEAYRQSDASNGEDAWLSEGQLNWLERAMEEEAERGRPIFVFLHQPLPETVSGSKTPANRRGVVQHERLRSILSRYPQSILFTGHTHWELSSADTLVCGPFTMVNSSSVYEPYSEEDRAYGEEERMSEGLVAEVYGDEVRIRGRSFDRGQWVDAADFRIPLNAAAP